MGFFSGIGKAIKKVAGAVSIKNVTNLATGNVSAVVKDVSGRLVNGAAGIVTSTAGSLANGVIGKITGSGGSKSTPTNVVIPQSVLGTAQQIVEQAVTNKLQPVSDKIQDAIANDKNLQGATQVLTRLWFQSMWTKYKTWIIVGALTLVGGVFYFRSRRTVRRPVRRW